MGKGKTWLILDIHHKNEDNFNLYNSTLMEIHGAEHLPHGSPEKN
jgi:hypothetical protein